MDEETKTTYEAQGNNPVNPGKIISPEIENRLPSGVLEPNNVNNFANNPDNSKSSKYAENVNTLKKAEKPTRTKYRGSFYTWFFIYILAIIGPLFVIVDSFFSGSQNGLAGLGGIAAFPSYLLMFLALPLTLIFGILYLSKEQIASGRKQVLYAFAVVVVTTALMIYGPNA